MGWKTRGGRSYFYQSERQGGRVVSRYVGSGEVASLMAELGAIDRERREIERMDRRASGSRPSGSPSRIARACRKLTVAAEAILEGSGYHRHHRGQWRRRRTMSAPASAAPAGDIAAESLPALAERYRSGDEAARKEVRGMLAKADKGDKDAAWKVGQLMRAAAEIAERTGRDIAYAVEPRMIRRAFGEKALATAEGVRLKLRSFAELAGPTPSAVERLLAERVALCWLDCHYAEYMEIAATSGRSFAQADFTAHQRNRAHRRYLSALKALAAVRKLPIVAVQVNMGSDAVPGGRG